MSLARAACYGLLLGALGHAVGCAHTLGLDDYHDAVAELCKCDQAMPKLPGSCVNVLSTRLDSAAPTTRERWLSYYAEHCAGDCGHAFDCFQQAGTCAQIACVSDEECCGHDEGASCDQQAGTCQGGA